MLLIAELQKLITIQLVSQLYPVCLHQAVKELYSYVFQFSLYLFTLHPSYNLIWQSLKVFVSYMSFDIVPTKEMTNKLNHHGLMETVDLYHVESRGCITELASLAYI